MCTSKKPIQIELLQTNLHLFNTEMVVINIKQILIVIYCPFIFSFYFTKIFTNGFNVYYL